MRSWLGLARDAARNFERDDGFVLASHIALSGLTAIFPFLIFVTSLAGLLGVQRIADAGTQHSRVEALSIDGRPEHQGGVVLSDVEQERPRRHRPQPIQVGFLARSGPNDVPASHALANKLQPQAAGCTDDQSGWHDGTVSPRPLAGQ